MLSYRFWTGSTGKALCDAGQTAQLVALHLLSSPHANFISIYRLPLAYAAADLRMSEDDVLEAMLAIQLTGFIKYDRDAEVVWVVEGARWQLGESLNGGDKRVMSTQREFDEIPPQSALRQEFFQRYGQAYQIELTNDAIKRRPMRGASRRSPARAIDAGQQGVDDWDACADIPQARLRNI